MLGEIDPKTAGERLQEAREKVVRSALGADAKRKAEAWEVADKAITENLLKWGPLFDPQCRLFAFEHGTVMLPKGATNYYFGDGGFRWGDDGFNPGPGYAKLQEVGEKAVTVFGAVADGTAPPSGGPAKGSSDAGKHAVSVFEELGRTSAPHEESAPRQPQRSFEDLQRQLRDR
jgi:hypothetical protein